MENKKTVEKILELTNAMRILDGKEPSKQVDVYDTLAIAIIIDKLTLDLKKCGISI